MEFCERLIPSKEDLNKAIKFTVEKKINFTFVTPYVTEDYLKRIDSLLRLVEKKVPNSEVVINDWGVLNLINKKYKTLKPVLGRLLNKMRREPRMMNLLNRIPKRCMDELKTPEITVDSFRKALKENNIQRIEFDNVLQGIINVNLHKHGFNGSLYLPFAYVTTTRSCLTNSCKNNDYTIVGIFPCKKDCQNLTFKLTYKTFPVPLIIKGNTQFFKNEKIPENLIRIGINRIVNQPEIPI